MGPTNARKACRILNLLVRLRRAHLRGDRDPPRQQGGGAATVIRHRASDRKLPGAPQPRGGISAYSCLIFPGNAETAASRLTGVYVPLSADATPEMIASQAGPDTQTMDSGDSGLLFSGCPTRLRTPSYVVNHLLVTDFNQYI